MATYTTLLKPQANKKAHTGTADTFAVTAANKGHLSEALHTESQAPYHLQ